MNFAFYISGYAGTFRNILISNLDVLTNTKLVVSDSKKNIDLKSTLKHFNIKYSVNDYNDSFSDYMLNLFLENQIDYCFCFGHHILKGKILDTFKNKIINFHPSILPLHPGVNSIDQAMLDNKSILLGNTAHFIDNGVDTGPIIMQSIAPKTLFKTQGYKGIIDLQLPMLEFIYKKLLENKIIIKNNKVTIKNTQCTPSYFYNN